MSKKHLACVVIIVLIVVLVQITLSMNKHLFRMRGEASKAKTEAANTSLQLGIERAQYAELEKSSKSLIEYLNVWQPYFRAVDSAQNAELKISLRIKEDNLVSLSQRYETVSNPGNAYLPSIVRAHLTFEDDYVRLLNWLGQVESQLPTLRVSNVRLTRGTGGNDLKMELTLEQPLVRNK
jgi:hypothetical protein